LGRTGSTLEDATFTPVRARKEDNDGRISLVGRHAEGIRRWLA